MSRASAADRHMELESYHISEKVKSFRESRGGDNATAVMSQLRET